MKWQFQSKIGMPKYVGLLSIKRRNTFISCLKHRLKDLRLFRRNVSGFNTLFCRSYCFTFHGDEATCPALYVLLLQKFFLSSMRQKRIYKISLQR